MLSCKNLNNNLKIRNRSNSLSTQDNQTNYFSHIFNGNSNFSVGNNVNYLNNNDNNNIYVDNNSRISIKNKEIMPKEKLLPETNNKTANNFYPLNMQKNREQELINIYSKQNEIIDSKNNYPDTYRDNKEFIDFNYEDYNDMWFGTNEIIYESYYDPKDLNNVSINYNYYYNFNNYNNNYTTNYYNGMNQNVQNGNETPLSSPNHNHKESLSSTAAVIINPKLNTENTTISTKNNLTTEKNRKLNKKNNNINKDIVKINEFDFVENNVLNNNVQASNNKKNLKSDNNKNFVNDKKLKKKEFPNDSVKTNNPKKITDNKNNINNKQIQKNSPNAVDNKKIKNNYFQHNNSNNNKVILNKGEIFDNNNSKSQNFNYSGINYLSQRKNQQSPKDNKPKKLIKINSCSEQINFNNNQNYDINININPNNINNNNNTLINNRNNSYSILNNDEKKQHSAITQKKDHEILNSLYGSIYPNKNRQRDEMFINHSIRLKSKKILIPKEDINTTRQKSNSFAIMDNMQLNKNVNNSILSSNYTGNVNNTNNNNINYMNNNPYNYINSEDINPILYVNPNIYSTRINNSVLNNNKNIVALSNENNNKNAYIQNVFHENGKDFNYKKIVKSVAAANNIKRKKNVSRKKKCDNCIVNIIYKSKSKSKDKSNSKIIRVNNKNKILSEIDNDSVIDGDSDYFDINDEKNNTTPKKRGDNLKVNPKILLNCFISELNRYSNEERSNLSLRQFKMK